MVTNYQNGVIAQLLQAIIGQINFDGTPTSNIGDILLSILEQTPYDKEPKSVLAELFLKLKDKLEGRAFTPYDKEPKSAIAEILLSILNETEYDKEPNSRIAELLLELKSELESYAELTASGAIANFTTSVVKPLVNLTAYFKATQEAGTPTPQSPKAISGVSAVSVPHCHKNIFSYDENRIAQAETSTQTIRSYYNLGFKNCTIAFSGSFKSGITPDNTRLNIGKLNNGILTILSDFIKEGAVNDRVVTFGANDTAVIMYTAETVIGLKTAIEKFDLQLEVGSQVTSYEAYNGSTTLINLGGTYYGGYVTQDRDGKRELVVTHKAKTKLKDLGYWNYSESGNRFFINNISDVIQKTDWNRHIGLCECYIEGRVGNNQGDNLAYGFYNNSLYIRDTDYSDVATWLSAVGDNYMLYELAEPFTVALPDGEPITAFNGVNNIYNDSGDTSVTYLAKIADNLNATAKFRAEVKAQKEKAKEELKEDVKEDVKELEPIKDSGEKKRGA